jgi:hypothetical protein
MALKSGLAAQLGIVPEVTFQTPVVVTRFVPFVSENINAVTARIDSKAIIANRRTQDASQWVPGDITVGGQITTELFDHSLGMVMKGMFGGSVITGAGPYTNTLTPSDLPSFTVQVGRPAVGGTVQPFTYPGMKVNKWTVSAAAGQIATLMLDMAGTTEIRVRTVADGVTTNTSPTITSATAVFTQDDVGKPISSGTAAIPATATILSVTNATTAVLSANATATTAANTFTIGVALATASYTTMNPVSYVSGSLTIGGTSVPVKQVTLTGDNKQDVGRRFLGSQVISEMFEIDQRVYSVAFTPEYVDNTLYGRFVNGTTAALVFTLASGTNTYVFTLNVRFDGDTPNVTGRKIVENPMKAVAIGTTDAAAITLVTTNSDAAL